MSRIILIILPTIIGLACEIAVAQHQLYPAPISSLAGQNSPAVRLGEPRATGEHRAPTTESRFEKTNQEPSEKGEEPGENKEKEKEWEEEFVLRGKFEDGFTLETKDEEYQLRIRIMEQTDFRHFIPDDQQPARTGFYIPRFRAYFEGHLTRPIEYELSLQRSVEGAFDVLDANVNFNYIDPLQIKVGRFIVPYSYTWYDHLEQYFIAPERPLYPLNFGLSRLAGVMAHGKIADGELQYAAGAFIGQLSGVADTNTTREIVGYLNSRPFLHTCDCPLQFLNVGASFSFGQQKYPDETLPLRTSIQASENDEAAQAASAIFLAFDEEVVMLGPRSQAAAHLAWYYRQFSFEAEWQAGRFSFFHQEEKRQTSVPVHGYHLTLSYFLTGEWVQGRKAVKPLRPFHPGRCCYGPGAIELFARYSQLRLDDVVFTNDLADRDLWSNAASIVDLGFNWYLNEYIKFYFDWQHAMFGSPVVQNQQGRFSRYNDMLWARCQVFF